ncbi:MAG: hypothetical protein IKA03_05240 [Alphaproteobacteria bacterium]|nr:hypothetical protein [Alphaproteobacteria bacterium]
MRFRGGVNPLVELVLELFELGASLIKSLFQWKVENGKWKIIFIFPCDACSTLQDKPSQLTLSKEGKSVLESGFQLTPPVEKGEGRVGAGLHQNNPNTTSKIFKTTYYLIYLSSYQLEDNASMEGGWKK